MKHNKKAQIQQIVYFMVLIFTIAITILISKVIFNEFDDALERGDMHTTESRKALRDMDTAFPTLDNAILMIFNIINRWVNHNKFFYPDTFNIYVHQCNRNICIMFLRHDTKQLVP